jgi:GTP cyclohydrolase IA
MQGRRRVTKNKHAEAHAGGTIQTIHNVAVNRMSANNGAAANGLEQYTTQELYGELLARFDGDPTRDGLLKTPERMEKAMTFLTQGYRQDPQEILRAALFDVDYDEMVMVKDIEMYSLCEHHMLPFFGKVHIAYIPQGKVVGLSKLPRLVDVFARRLQVQERMTREIANALQEAIAPQGVGVVCEARHLCMMMRGVEKQNSSTVTSAMSGVFLEDKTRAEFLSLVRDNGRNSF